MTSNEMNTHNLTRIFATKNGIMHMIFILGINSGGKILITKKKKKKKKAVAELNKTILKR